MWDAETNWRSGAARTRAVVREGPFPRRVRDGPTGKFHFKPNWARFGPRGHEDARAARPLRRDRQRDAGQALPPRGRARAHLPQLHVHGDCPARSSASGGRRRSCTPTTVRRSASATATGSPSATSAGRSSSTPQPRPGQQRGVVVVEGIWPNKHFENGIGINALTSGDPGYPNGGAVFHDTAVWVRKA